MHGHCPECPAVVGAEPNKMRLGKLGTCLAFRHASWGALANDGPIIIATARTGIMRIVIAKVPPKTFENQWRIFSCWLMQQTFVFCISFRHDADSIGAVMQ